MSTLQMIQAPPRRSRRPAKYRPRLAQPKTRLTAVASTEAWRSWIESLADEANLSFSDLLATAAEEYAARRGFQPPPPR